MCGIGRTAIPCLLGKGALNIDSARSPRGPSGTATQGAAWDRVLADTGPIKREIASNDKGVSIEPWGAYGAHRQILFKYNDKDIAIEFAARRSPRSVAEHGEINVSGADFPLGPICEVWIDDRRMEFGVRPLSAGEKATIKETITDFLTTVFRDCSYAVPPYAEQVEFL